CNTFFQLPLTPTTSVDSSKINSSTDPMYCTNYSQDLKGEIRAVKIRSANRPIGGTQLPTPGLNSGCLSSSSYYPNYISLTGEESPYAESNGLSLPLASTPIIVETFKDTQCTRPYSVFLFDRGMTAGNPSHFDHHLSENTSNQMKLVLPASKTR